MRIDWNSTLKATGYTDKTHTLARNKTIPSWQRYSRYWMAALLGISDVVVLLSSGGLAWGLYELLTGRQVNDEIYLRLALFIPVFVIVYALYGLYPAVGLGPVEELRRVTTATSVVVLLLISFTFFNKTGATYSRVIIAFIWVFSLVGVQAGRWLLRIVAVRMGVWGEPVAIVGHGQQVEALYIHLMRNFRFGLHPVIVLDGFARGGGEVDTDLPVLRLGNEKTEREALQRMGVRTAILVPSEMPAYLQRSIVAGGRFGFRRVILLSEYDWIGSVGVTPYDMEGVLALEINQNLFSRTQQLLKRAIDLGLVIAGSFVVLPVIALIWLLIRLDSPGSAFYTHERIGRWGKKINVWKFRTMVPDADTILDAYLTAHPELRAEWEETHKLKNDPRITRIGQILRKLSLDELPQLWNVLKGEMSIVGPRPIVTEEIRHYRDRFSLYKRVRPGITGLWQVSGRNDVSYENRVRLDEHYVRNWSIWLDIYILLRTFWVVARQDGAY